MRCNIIITPSTDVVQIFMDPQREGPIDSPLVVRSFVRRFVRLSCFPFIKFLLNIQTLIFVQHYGVFRSQLRIHGDTHYPIYFILFRCFWIPKGRVRTFDSFSLEIRSPWTLMLLSSVKVFLVNTS